MCAQQQSRLVLSENRAEKLGGFKRVLRELYKLIICTSEGSDCLQKRFDGILFSSSLHVIPIIVLNLLNLNTALLRETAVFSFSVSATQCQKVDLQRLIFTFSLCAVSVWPKTD